MKEEIVTERRKIGKKKKKTVIKLFIAYLFQFFYPDRNLGGEIISQAI